MPEKSVKLKLLFHREVNCVGIYFEKDFEVIAHVKKIPNVKFSLTHRCWYVPAGPDTISNIIETLRNKVWVDLSGIKKVSEQKIKTAELPAVISNTEITSNEEARIIALEQIRKKLKIKNYSPSTAKTYLDQLNSFLRFFPDSYPEDLGEDEIQHYLLHLIENRKLSVSTQNQAINSIKFYYEKVLKQERKVYNLDRPMKEKRLPEILSQEEMMAIFEVTKNLKHRLMLMLIYASGLRRSELLNLRIGDVDLDRCIVL
ncbi:MAG: phage integrase N-terminal SAM-like domain-containing protein, partial [Cyclobacteriaceae bacterium]|nr:phage integrase N-terminal SAM-like domain-containing protein [Cyclobacteriaceae bacterium]